MALVLVNAGFQFYEMISIIMVYIEMECDVYDIQTVLTFCH